MERFKRFVIQEHIRKGEVHWDLMLERIESLETYRLDIGPEAMVENKGKATKIFDHPMRFLTYEGSVNKGLGSVRIVDKGRYRLTYDSEESRIIELKGNVLEGRYYLKCVGGDKWEFGQEVT